MIPSVGLARANTNGASYRNHHIRDQRVVSAFRRRRGAGARPSDDTSVARPHGHAINAHQGPSRIDAMRHDFARQVKHQVLVGVVLINDQNPV
jgi:hypothetical protein